MSKDDMAAIRKASPRVEYVARAFPGAAEDKRKIQLLREALLAVQRLAHVPPGFQDSWLITGRVMTKVDEALKETEGE